MQENMSIILDIKVIPKSKQSKIKIDKSGNTVFYLKSVPEDNKANEELIDILSNKLKIIKSNIGIISGIKSRNKKIKFIDTNLTKELVLALLLGDK